MNDASRLALAGSVLAVSLTGPANALGQRPILHEPIPPDPREDLAMHVALDGELPAAIQTPSGIVGAPDPRAPPSRDKTNYGFTGDHSTFSPDRDTRRPDVSTYDDPFTPATAPFKRLEAFDAVRSDYTLYVRDERLAPLAFGAPPERDDDAFYADLVVDLSAGARVRIPTVGPGARIVRARLGVGAEDISFKAFRDGADNWFLQPALRVSRTPPDRARLVMEVAIPRATFGGQIGDPSWGDLLFFPPLPDNVARDAKEVCTAVGVSRDLRPREAIARLVRYFRGFADSDEPPTGRRNVYLDLALSKKGVCRHRAFAFLVTAQSLGIPTRMAMNEAHAWVEVYDGKLWRRIDLGGAGHMSPPTFNALADRIPYSPPPDAFGWPPGSDRGDDVMAQARAQAESGGVQRAALSGAGTPASDPGSAAASRASSERDDRPTSLLSIEVAQPDALRGSPVKIQGAVRAEDEPCPHVAVELWLRDVQTQKKLFFGTLATGDDGTFSGGIVLPAGTPLGDYDVLAETSGDARCGAGSTEPHPSEKKR
jgi:transglutaminase-like putative cysteine protease